ncbi:ArnT family glycosyltransferase [Pseudoxanthomonas yeongjuensis]|uniref:ArnT family glycosyltransferase n=1 Tax=Pseudoxanthomonas yeongjuensis TaxID=377616 RepID=UPI001390BDCF|nr:hypothetical protein [Pseudoxanthomonas yeongjuensis]
MPLSRRNTLLLSLTLLVLTAGVYWPGLSGRFLLDDFSNIVSNDRVHAATLDWKTIKTAASAYQPGDFGRPLATVTFAVNHAIGGTDPWGYKVANLLVHLANALLVFWLLQCLLALPRIGTDAGRWRTPVAFTVALLWAIHPLQVSTVLYVVQRMEMLSLTFVLLALLAYLRGRLNQRKGTKGWPWLALSALLGATGTLGKETAVLFPFYTLSLELTVLGFHAQTPRVRRFLKIAYATGLAIAFALFVIWVIPQYSADDSYAIRDFTAYERVLSQFRVLPMYLGQILLPLPDSMPFYYDTFQKSSGWLDPATTLAGAIFLLVLIFTAWKFRQRMPLVALGIFLFFAAHLLTSNVFNVELVFEHRNYFALLGILLTVGDLVRRIPVRDGPAIKYVAVGAIVLAFGFLAILRTATFGSALHLAMDLVAKNQASTRASMDLGTVYLVMSNSNPNSPFFSMAAQEFERGSRLPNSSPLPEQGLILMAATTGQPVRAEWWDGLVKKIRTRPASPQEVAAVTGLMKQRYAGIEMDDHRLSQAYAALLVRAPSPQFYARYGDYALTYLHDEGLADRMFVAAIESNPSDSEYAARIFANLTADGHARQAAAVHRRAVSLGLMNAVQGAQHSEESATSSPAVPVSH